MSRPPVPYERKRQYVVSLLPTVAEWLRAYGHDNLSGGIEIAARQLTDIDALYPADTPRPPSPQLYGSPEERRQAADELVRSGVRAERRPRGVATSVRDQIVDLQRQEQHWEEMRSRARSRARALSQGFADARTTADQAEFDSLVREYFLQSREAFVSGLELPLHLNLKYTNRNAYDEVMKRCREAFGWECGPKPPVPSVDDVFGSVGDERDEQSAARKSRNEPGPAGMSRNEPGAIGAEGALHGSKATSMQEPSEDTTGPEGAPGEASPAPVASTATETVSSDPGRSALAGVSEPAF